MLGKIFESHDSLLNRWRSALVRSSLVLRSISLRDVRLAMLFWVLILARVVFWGALGGILLGNLVNLSIICRWRNSLLWQRGSRCFTGFCSLIFLRLHIFHLLFFHSWDLLLRWCLCRILRGNWLRCCCRGRLWLHRNSILCLDWLLGFKGCYRSCFLLFTAFCEYRNRCRLWVWRGRGYHSTSITLLTFVWTIRLKAKDFRGDHCWSTSDLVIIFMHSRSLECSRPSRFVGS